MLCEFKISTEAVGLGIHPDKTKILSNQDKVKAKEIEVDNIKIEILGEDSKREIPWAKDHVRGPRETEEVKNRLKAAWAAFHKCRQELTSKDYRPLPQTPPFQHGGNTDDDICQQHMDTNAET